MAPTVRIKSHPSLRRTLQTGDKQGFPDLNIRTISTIMSMCQLTKQTNPAIIQRKSIPSMATLEQVQAPAPVGPGEIWFLCVPFVHLLRSDLFYSPKVNLFR